MVHIPHADKQSGTNTLKLTQKVRSIYKHFKVLNTDQNDPYADPI